MPPIFVGNYSMQALNSVTNPMRTLVVTAANEMFAPLLRGLVGSLQQWGTDQFTALACFDLGLALESRTWLERFASHIAVPDWDLPVDSQLRAAKPDLRALTVRPFLRDYFPGYDVYLWIDADAWVQEQSALQLYVSLAAQGHLVAAQEVDRAYRQTEGIFSWRAGRMAQCYGQQAANQTIWGTYFNNGVFALHAQASHWAPWAKWFRAGLETSGGLLCCDQTALNYAIWQEQLPVYPLSARYNWLCHLAVPAFDMMRNQFFEPFEPRQTIGIMHLAGDSKNIALKVKDGNQVRTIGLRFAGS
jgi:lipopolysaccharide biosynthesis glycosyltransferase